MKITFSNLGTIKKTSLDLRPLTVIIGPNNSSKTYVAYTVYGLLKSLPAAFITAIDAREVSSRKVKKTVQLKIDDELATLFNKRLALATASFLKGMSIFFQDTSGTLFARTRLGVHVDTEELLGEVDKLARAFRAERRISVADKVASIELGEGEDATSCAAAFATHLGRSLTLGRPFLLPAERNAFILSYRMLANRRYKLMRETQQTLFQFNDPQRLASSGKAANARGSLKEFNAPGGRKSLNVFAQQIPFGIPENQAVTQYPKPLEDFLDFLTDIEIQDDAGSAGGGAAFTQLADSVEQSIQSNNRLRFEPTPHGGRKLEIDIEGGPSIDLYNASSSIKQLASLLLYLRHRARPDDLLIIDEPEMNLHPEAQAKLLEILGILVNLGVHVLLTTHSPYLMTHLNNITSGDTSRPAALKRQASSLYLKDERAFLPLSQVSAYEMKGNELRSLKDEDYGIRWDTLSDVSVDLQQRYFEIDEKGRSRRVKTA